MPASLAVSDARNYPARNLSMPLWAEFYMDFTALGMAAIMMAIGRLSSRLDAALVGQPFGRLAGVGPGGGGAPVGVGRPHGRPDALLRGGRPADRRELPAAQIRARRRPPGAERRWPCVRRAAPWGRTSTGRRP